MLSILHQFTNATRYCRVSIITILQNLKPNFTIIVTDCCLHCYRKDCQKTSLESRHPSLPFPHTFGLLMFYFLRLHFFPSAPSPPPVLIEFGSLVQAIGHWRNDLFSPRTINVVDSSMYNLGRALSHGVIIFSLKDSLMKYAALLEIVIKFISIYICKIRLI